MQAEHQRQCHQIHSHTCAYEARAGGEAAGAQQQPDDGVADQHCRQRQQCTCLRSLAFGLQVCGQPGNQNTLHTAGGHKAQQPRLQARVGQIAQHSAPAAACSAALCMQRKILQADNEQRCPAAKQNCRQQERTAPAGTECKARHH